MIETYILKNSYPSLVGESNADRYIEKNKHTPLIIIF